MLSGITDLFFIILFVTTLFISVCTIETKALQMTVNSFVPIHKIEVSKIFICLKVCLLHELKCKHLNYVNSDFYCEK